MENAILSYRKCDIFFLAKQWLPRALYILVHLFAVLKLENYNLKLPNQTQSFVENVN